MDILKVILTSILSAVSLFIIAKVMGHKQMSQLDFFDYITGITIGSIAAERFVYDSPSEVSVGTLCVRWQSTRFGYS
jgi:uncharacterized membrane protein YcaP (DUF421 family)